MSHNSDEVIEMIKGGGTKMHSRAYFAAQAMLVIIGIVLLLALIFFTATFIVFALQQNGGLFATNFGFGGWCLFLQSFPWILLLLSFALILILWMLLRRYAVVSHQPFLYLFLIVIVAIALLCFFIPPSFIHGGIFRYASKNRIPMIAGVYGFETSPMSGIYRGRVVALATSSFVLGNTEGQTSTVLVASAVLPELKGVNPGNYVIIFGRAVATTTIEAFGVKVFVDYQ